jgi:glucose-6-phosphate isomerase
MGRSRIVGIGGSSLGPQLICDAAPSDAPVLPVHFLDNADPEGIDGVLRQLQGRLGRTLVSVVSKSGATPTPRHVHTELAAAYRRAGLDFACHAVATTMPGSALDRRARAEQWLASFPIWDWVGGRTSITSAVGLLPAALRGIDIDGFLAGAAAMDRLTRMRDTRQNLAALLALMWYWLGDGRGARNMVLLPYKDRLSLLPRYLQQLVMESIGKRLDRTGATVHQGMTVFGHKGATDQHSYIQQLRDGPADFFVVFLAVRRHRRGPSIEISPGTTLGDYLFFSLEGTREALYDAGRDSITIAIPDLEPPSIGALVALLERAVGLYAELIDVNAYHQPAVDKEIAEPGAALQRAVLSHLGLSPTPRTAEEIAVAIDRPAQVERIYKLLEILAGDPDRGVIAEPGPCRFAERFSLAARRVDDARATEPAGVAQLPQRRQQQ